MGERCEINIKTGKVIHKKEGSLVSALRDIAEKLFFRSSQKKITAIVWRTPQGLKYDVQYDGNLVVPDLMDCAAWAQRVAERRLNQNGNRREEFSAYFKNYDFDPIGFKRLAGYLSGGLV